MLEQKGTTLSPHEKEPFLTFIALFFVIAQASLPVSTASAQALPERSANAVTFEQLYDEPMTSKSCSMAFSRSMPEVSATNTNAGFGGYVQYTHENKFSVTGQMRMTYGSAFFDFNHQLALNNSNRR